MRRHCNHFDLKLFEKKMIHFIVFYEQGYDMVGIKWAHSPNYIFPAEEFILKLNQKLNLFPRKYLRFCLKESISISGLGDKFILLPTKEVYSKFLAFDSFHILNGL